MTTGQIICSFFLLKQMQTQILFDDKSQGEKKQGASKTNPTRQMDGTSVLRTHTIYLI